MLSTHEEVDYALSDICVLPKEACDTEKVESEEDEEDYEKATEYLVHEKSMYSHTGDLLDQNEKLGAWEIYTRGIGSKLLRKMGWQEGQGRQFS